MDKFSIIDVINIISPIILGFVGYVIKGLNDSIKEFKVAVNALRQDLTSVMSASARGEQDILMLKRDVEIVVRALEEQRKDMNKIRETTSLLKAAHNACEFNRIPVNDSGT